MQRVTESILIDVPVRLLISNRISPVMRNRMSRNRLQIFCAEEWERTNERHGGEV